ncbi:sensor histidine kinase [Microbacterium sp. EYE_5]|uniref:ATP-binding protein n=1 Tax=unclassified Microbacterium TaxID=2609290 RepID=UPI0020069CA9|nr:MULTISPECIES: sensor histidine kinase [unclassified Microbacterium]MCK6081244.1 sensor histidine kinase [Microbacterium sp. EYE_382]MCK6086514.1 sensor histidine kinase [Microbacterium sp. EYE_384]MCK6123988.1 sensor histidine kinase [Microbacterium sp. EYE_80]MCK6126897.1 sensor histidine kinase [Microbacterium sp. EYE_79]MCK6142199.1 sensor histidine kinase [Microbacterium sp. EYE_39]
MPRAMSLRWQLLLLQAFIVCVVIVLAGIVAITLQERSIRDSYRERMVGVALSISRLPTIVEAFDDPDPSATIQPLAEVIREASDLTYVVVTDADGIRYSHPNEDRIGESVSTDPSAPLSGQVWSGTETGTLGESYRVKVPLYAGGGESGEVIGSVSVGVLESELAADVQSRLPWLLLALGGSAVVGVFGAAGVAALIRRRILGLEPEQIAELVGERETMLHRLSEGVVRVDRDGVVASANDAAVRLLGAGALVGERAADVLEGPILDVLEHGEREGRLVLAGERPLIARATGLRDDDGRPVGGTLLLRDHTELHQAVREMDGQQSLTDGLRAQAHEFANSMHVVSGLLELGAWDDARDFIARMQPGGSLDIGTASEQLGPEVAALLSAKFARAKELGIAMSVDAEGVVPADAFGDLVTVVGNLVDNALDACRSGDALAVAVRSGADGVRVTVDDSGPGVDPAVAARVFDEGVSTKDPSARTRGVGLALVRRIARRRSGDVRLERSPLGGARFAVVLPVEARVS